MTPEEVRQQIFLMTPTLRAAACISLLAIAGCTTLQVYGQNKSNQKIAFFAKVGDKDKLDSEVNPFNNLAATKVGDFFPGSTVQLYAVLPRGGRVAHRLQILQREPDPLTLALDVSSVTGQTIDLGRNEDLEKEISDITLSYMPPTTIATDMLSQHLGAIYLVTDNPNDASAPR